MPIVQVYECPATGQLFKAKDHYLGHLRTLARERIDKRADDKRKAAKAAFFAGMREQCQTVEDIRQFIIDNWQAFVKNGNDRGYVDERFECPPSLRSIKINLSIKDRVSNSHNAPLGTKTNWHQEPDRPTAYAGMKGELRISYYGGTNIMSVFDGTGLHTGTGSGCSHPNMEYNFFSSEFYLFFQDWPALERNHLMANTMKKLNPEGQYGDFVE